MQCQPSLEEALAEWREEWNAEEGDVVEAESKGKEWFLSTFKPWVSCHRKLVLDKGCVEDYWAAEKEVEVEGVAALH